jgi:hypothetical protein
VDRLDHGGRPVAEVLAAQPTGEVDVLATVDVPDARAFGPVDDQRSGGDAARDELLAGGDDRLGLDALAQPHAPIFSLRRRRD